MAAPAAAQRGQAQSYPVSAFVLEYPLPHPDHPPLEALRALELEMRVTRGGLMQPHPATENVRFRLGDVPPGTRIWATGLQYVSRTLLEEFERRRIGGVIITLPDLEERTGRDLRAPGETRLRVRIWTGRVESLATIADGDRFPGTPAERTNRPEHRFVREGSPVQAAERQGLIDPRAIEEWSRRLSRHPGRRVDAVLRPGEVPGATRLEYHVAEHKPWQVYAQLSNTGTDTTTRARQRFGLQHTQLTGHDDVLRLDYVTGNFDEVHAGFGSYEGPVWGLPRLRWRASGSWSEYDASEVGLARLDFEGEQWEAGGRLTANLLQVGGFFLDAFGGGRWRRVGVENALAISASLGGEAEDDFALAEGGLGVHYDGLSTSLALEAGVVANLPDLADTGERRRLPAGNSVDELSLLGRQDPSRHFELLTWNGSLSFYLEPILLYGRGWGDPSSPARSTLAHEVVLSSRGQWAFDDRLVPQFQQVAGGLHTVRGYEQSVVAGDGAVIGTLEYRLHLARLIDPGEQVLEVPLLGPFELRPRTVFARPDWDLVLKAFYDAARTYETRSDNPFVNATEPRESLAAFGLGIELQLLRHLRAGVDVAWPRSRLADESRPSDNPHLHGVVTLMF